MEMTPVPNNMDIDIPQDIPDLIDIPEDMLLDFDALAHCVLEYQW